MVVKPPQYYEPWNPFNWGDMGQDVPPGDGVGGWINGGGGGGGGYQKPTTGNFASLFGQLFSPKKKATPWGLDAFYKPRQIAQNTWLNPFF